MNRIIILRHEETLASCDARGEALLHFHGEYQPGDTIVMESDSAHMVVTIDHTVAPARLYVPQKRWIFRLPLEGDLPLGYPPFAFQGDNHLLTLHNDTENEYRNLACNPADQRHDSGAYPHASANVETRDESVFFARNVIDGLHIAASHGSWPYLSWGIGGRPDATIRLNFGREVSVDTMTLYLRADFIKSGHWIGGTLHLSDGYTKAFPLKGIDGPQTIDFEGTHTITWAVLDQLTKDDPASKYPSLRQWEIFGKDKE